MRLNVDLLFEKERFLCTVYIQMHLTLLKYIFLDCIFRNEKELLIVHLQLKKFVMKSLLVFSTWYWSACWQYKANMNKRNISLLKWNITGRFLSSIFSSSQTKLFVYRVFTTIFLVGFFFCIVLFILRVLHTPGESSAYKSILLNYLKIWTFSMCRLENDQKIFSILGEKSTF